MFNLAHRVLMCRLHALQCIIYAIIANITSVKIISKQIMNLGLYKKRIKTV